MNQILYVGENKGNGPIAIKSIVKFFAIVIIAFGIILIGKGSYAIYKNIEINSGDNIPVVYTGGIFGGWQWNERKPKGRSLRLGKESSWRKASRTHL